MISFAYITTVKITNNSFAPFETKWTPYSYKLLTNAEIEIENFFSSALASIFIKINFEIT